MVTVNLDFAGQSEVASAADLNATCVQVLSNLFQHLDIDGSGTVAWGELRRFGWAVNRFASRTKMGHTTDGMNFRGFREFIVNGLLDVFEALDCDASSYLEVVEQEEVWEAFGHSSIFTPKFSKSSSVICEYPIYCLK